MIPVFEHIKALIFDCDGTLADSMPIHHNAWHATFSAHGVKCEQDFLDKVAGMPSKDIIALFNKTFAQQLDADTFVPQREKRIFEDLFNVQPIIPVVNIAKQYHGKLPMCVASGGTKHNVTTTLEAIGIKHLFDAIITADDPVKPKPAPDIFLHAAKYMNVAPEDCQVFEDGAMGLLAAERAGMVVTDVRPWVKEWRIASSNQQ